MKPLLTLFIPTVLLYGCGSDLPDPNIITPQGHRITFYDQGSMALHDVAALFDQAVDDAAIYLWRYGLTYRQVRDVAVQYPYIVYDHFKFKTSASYTGYASGQIYVGKVILLAFYTRAYNDLGPAWTHFDWGGTTDTQSGMLPAVPALAHEYAHHFFGPNSEHVVGYPPIINMPAALPNVFPVNSLRSLPKCYCNIEL